MLVSWRKLSVAHSIDIVMSIWSGQGRYAGRLAVTVVVLALVAGCSSTPPLPTLTESPTPTPSNFTTPKLRASTQPEATWSLLQRGDTGYVVMMRHAIAPGTGDPPNFRLEDCSTQRNLAAAGKAQAVRMGEAFRRRNIRVARVLSSQWCRCLETARIMNLGTVEAFEPLNSFFSSRRTEPRQTAEVRRFIANNRSTQGVIIMLTHQVNITAITDTIPQPGESVVLRANQQGKVEWVGRLGAL